LKRFNQRSSNSFLRLPIIQFINVILIAGHLAAQAPTSLVLSSSANPSTLGQNITLTATVSPSNVTGKVTFYDGTIVLGTTPVTAGQAALKTSLLASGTRSLRALYAGNSGGLPSAATFTQTVNAVPQQGFGFGVVYGGFGGNPQAAAIADFNGDGKPDLAVADLFSKVYVSLNAGGGIFQTPVGYPAGFGPSAVAAGDFNGDGNTDLAVTNFNDNTVSVLPGNGDGTFQAPLSYAAGTEPQSVAVGDFNGDGKTDLAVADNAGRLSILLGNGDGTFQTAVSYPASPGGLSSSVTVGDFNGDGVADLAVANSGSSNISVFLGAGNGTFAPAVNYTTGLEPKSVTVGDFNGDGHADLVTANYLGNDVSVFLGKGDGTFAAAVSYAAGNFPQSVVAGDFNGDGIPDLAVADNNQQNLSGGNTAGVLLGAGNGTFAAPVNYATSANPAFLAAADFKGDGLSDLAVVIANNGVDILRGLPRPGTTPAAAGLVSSPNPSSYGQNVTLTATIKPAAATGTVTFYDGVALLGTGVLVNGTVQLTTSLMNPGTHPLTALYGGDTTYTAARTPAALTQTVNSAAQNGIGTGATYSAGRNPQSLAVADFNKDGKPDVATANVTSLSVFPGNGNGTLGSPVDYNTEATAIAAGDFNGDGNPDLVVITLNSFSQFVADIRLGNGDGTFQAPINLSTGGRGVVVGDLNQDGNADLVFFDTGSASIVLGNGDGTFGAPMGFAVRNSPAAVSVGDFNGDGKADLAFAINNGNTNGGVSIYLGNGDGTVQPAVNYTSPEPSYAITVGDLNGDGKADIVLTGSAFPNTSGTVSVLLGNGNGTFLPAVNATVSGIPESVILIDFNGDGKPDLAVGCQTIIGGLAAPNVAILQGKGDGTFQAGTTYATGNYPIAIAAGDFNGDGRVDVVTANYLDGTVTILPGLAPSAITLASSANPSVYSQPISLTATVSSPGATGLVTFYEGTTILGTLPLTSGQAVLTTDLLPPGTGTLQAVYEGNAVYAVSISASLSHNVTDVASNGPAEAGAITVGSMPQTVVAGDFNGDGIIDLAVTDSGGNSISVLLGSGNGSFQTPVPYPAGFNPYALAAGDFNGDGKVDLVSVVGAGVVFLPGNGDGTFRAPQTIPYGSSQVSWIAAGDFNRDGKADLVFAFFQTGQLSVLLGNGDGTFRASPAINAGPGSVAVGDFNGDGIADLVAGNSSINSVSVVVGNGDGTFQNPVTLTSGTHPASVAVGDFNGDGKQDFVAANQFSNNVSVFLNSGNGSFAPAVNYGAGQQPVSVVVGDFNGDGKADIAVANLIDGTISILTGNGDGTFQTAVNYAAGRGPTSVVTADFNRDGRADLAAANTFDNDLSVLLGAPVSAVITTSTELNARFTPVNFGDQETLKVLVTPSSATGTVTFLDGTNSLGTIPLSNGVATLSLTTLTAGVHSLSATYSGDAKDTSSVSAAVPVTVNQATTTTRLTSSANPSTPGQNIMLTGSVTPSTVNGSITFRAGLTSLGTVPLSAGTATFSVSTLPSGTNTLFADYSGDANNLASTGKLVQTVGSPTTTTTSLSAPPNPSTYGQSLTLTATMTSQASTGIITFYDGTTVLGVGPLVNGSASLTTRLLASGTRSLTAYYGGDFTHLASLSPKLTHTVNTLPASGFHPAPATAAGSVPFSVVAADFNGDGNIDLAVTDQGGSGQTGAGISVLPGNGDGTFQNTLTVNTGPSPVFLVTGDFNGDGKADLAYGSYASGQVNGSMNVLLGNGDGSFQTGAAYQVAGAGSPFLVSGDFNEDGFVDMAALGAGEVQLFPGNGDGTFHSGITYGLGFGVGATSATVGDFNGDGHADFALTTTNGTVGILFGNGNGTFQLPAVNFSVASSPGVLGSLSTGDFNGDGITDLAVAGYANSSTPGSVYVLLGKAGGTFQTAVGYAVDILPQSIAIGDFNGDGKTDIATANSATNGDISVLLGNGDGTFQAAVNYAADGLAQSLTSADFNGDGRIDFAIANSGTNNLTFLLGGTAASQTITFGTIADVVLGTAPFTISATASSGLTVILSSNTTNVCAVSGATVTLTGAGTCSITATQPGNTTYAAAAPVTRTFMVSVGSQTITFDAIPNQILGIAPFAIAAQATSLLPVGFASITPAVCTNSDDLVILLSPGTCSITASQPGNAAYSAAISVTRSFAVSKAKTSNSFIPTPGSPFGITLPGAMAVGDFNGDGVPDLAVASGDIAGPSTVTVLLGDGSGGFAASMGSPYTVGGVDSAVDAIVVGDFNGDGNLDIAAANQMSNNVVVLLGNGSGGFTPGAGSPFKVGEAPYSMAVADFNGDGIQDLVTANLFGGTVTVLLGNGSGAFAEAAGSPITVGPFVPSVATGDFNADGIPDLAVAGEGITVLLGNGTGGFTAAPGSPFASGTQPFSVVVGDFNGDGIQDLAAVDEVNLTVLLGDGSGGFRAATGSPFAAAGTPYRLNVADLNGDGFQDLVVYDIIKSNIGLLSGSGTGAFTLATISPLEIGTATGGVAVGDFNGDGIEDIAIAGENDITVLLGILTGSTTQTITFGPLPNVTLGVSPVTIAAVSDSGLPVSFASPTPLICTPTGNTVTMLRVGTCSIIASQPGNATYAPAPRVTQSFTVIGLQSIVFAAVPTQIIGGPAVTLSASAGSALAVTFASNSAAVCTVAGAAVTLISAGTCSITATQPGNSFYAPAEPVTVTFTVDPPFADLGDQTANEVAAIQLLATYGITSGCSTMPFDYCPDEAVTRGQMAVFIIRSIYGSNNFSYTQTPFFTDVPAGAQFFKYIQKMYDLGITKGETATTYGPNDTVTRGQMAVFIIRARYGAGVAFNYSQTPYFTDVPANAQFFQYIQKMKDVGITSGETATTYGPNDPVTRGQMAVFVMRGSYNLLLPAGTPALSTVFPLRGTAGTTFGLGVTGTNTNFVPGTTVLNAGTGIIVQGVVPLSATSLIAQLVIAPDAPLGPRSIVVTTGSEEAVLPNGFTITTDPATGIVAYFTGNNTTMNTESGLSGTLENGATYAPAASRFQGLPDAAAFSLNGTTSYVQAASGEPATLTGARMMTAWVYPNSFTGPGEPILTGGAGVAAGDIFGITGTTGTCSSGGQYQLYVDHGGTCYVSDNSLLPNRWSLVAATFDGSNVVFYINGVASVAVPSAQLFDYGVATLEIGGNTLGGTSSGASFSGLLSEVQVYNRALTPAEIQGIYAP
jgi:hypothetical protein